jgi:hypothetical protein
MSSAAAAQTPTQLRSQAIAAGSGAGDRAVSARRKAEQELEAIYLQALVAPMLARKDSGRLGAGAAGQHWQSLMAEQIAMSLAASGQLRLLATSPRAGAKSDSAPQALRCPAGQCAGADGWRAIVTYALPVASDAVTASSTEHVQPVGRQ